MEPEPHNRLRSLAEFLRVATPHGIAAHALDWADELDRIATQIEEHRAA